MNNNVPQSVSEPLQDFIDALVEEVVMEGRPFDMQKKWLRKYCEADEVDFEALEENLSNFFEVMEEWKSMKTKTSQLMGKMLAKDCFLSDSMMKKLMDDNVAPASAPISRPAFAPASASHPVTTQSDIEFVEPQFLMRGGSIVEIERGGRTLAPIGWDYADGFHEGLARVAIGKRYGDERYGFVDPMGNLVIPCVWKFADEAFSEGLAFVRNDKGECFYIDKSGRIAINSNPEYDYDVLGRGFHDGLTEVRKDGLYGFMDKSGRIAIPCTFQDVYSFEDGLALFQDERGKYGCIDTRGRVAIPCQYDESVDFYEGIATIYRDYDEGGSYLIDKTGRKICDLGFECGIVYFQEGLGSIEDYGFIDKTGKLVIEDVWSPEGFGFSEGLAPTWDGFIDRSGQVVIPGNWDDFGEFRDGLAKVKTNGKWGYVDHSGHMAIPNIWDYAGNFSEGLAVAELADRYFFINKQGKVLCKVK